MNFIKQYRKFLFFVVLFFCVSNTIRSQPPQLSVSGKESQASFPLAGKKSTASLFYDPADAAVVRIAANAFKADVEAITGKSLSLQENENISSEYAVIVGTIGHSLLIDELVKQKLIDVSAIKEKWESFSISVINKSYKKAKQLLVIAGSDRRGTAFGIFHLSRMMGVNPFAWWADVAPARQPELFVSGSYISGEPSVKYRGIFINDEDWGMQPWAAKNMDTDIKDIGPKTYAKVFELLLRLKANYIWPAMHPCTKAFYYYENNPKVADEYAIIVGGSHCEPMLRNNVFEWAENFENEYGKKPGEWRYDLNKEEIYKYWDDRIKQSANYESIYTIGMRGVHDGSMPGPKDPNEKLKLLENVIKDQRTILQQDLRRLSSDVPQIFVPYKEVLSLYQRGLPLADDITIIWPDDNYGYIRQLPNDTERKRSGGHGVYYHLSYWGSPQDYLWLSSTSPSLIAYEMSKAYYYGAKKLWVFNVGDIKPAELELQFAMDMAWDIKKYGLSGGEHYLYDWAEEIFGKQNAQAIAEIKKQYYSLAQFGKPEHLGMLNFSQKNEDKRLAAYRDISKKTWQLRSSIPARLQDAYFQLLLYPVVSATLMNEKIFFEKRSNELMAAKDEAGARSYFKQATNAFDSIKLFTDEYNTKIAGGKWNGMMSWHPRDLKVFNAPKLSDTIKKIGNAVADPIAVITAADFQLGWDTSAVTRNIETSGLGWNGKAVTVLPANLSNWPNLTTCENVNLFYKLKLETGKYSISVKWLPTFDVANTKKLEYSISLNEEPAQIINIHSEAESAGWKENVVKGYSMGQTIHTVDKNGVNEIRISIKNMNMVLLAVEVYKNNQ